MKVLKCPCGQYYGTSAKKRSKCPHCGRGRRMKLSKVFFKSNDAQEIRLAIQQLNQPEES